MKKFLLIAAIAAGIGYFSYAYFSSKRFAEFPVGKSFTVNFSYPDLAEEEFGDREKADQAKDWLLYTLMTNSGLETKEIANSSFDLAPVRYGFNQVMGNFEYGATRSRYIGDGEVVALVPASNEKERIDNLAHVFDETRKNQGERPRKAYVFEYVLNVEDKSARFARLKDVDAADYFTEKMGYYETKAQSVEDLKSFLGKIDDVTYAANKDGSLFFGGRKLQSGSYGKITIEDIAAIWQSEKQVQVNLANRVNKQDQVERDYKDSQERIINKYQEQLKALQFEDGTYLTDLTEEEQKEIEDYIVARVQDKAASILGSPYKRDNNLQQFIRNFKAELEEMRERVGKEVAQFVKDSDDSRVAYSSGFSLDPAINFEASIEFVSKYGYWFEKVLAPQFTVDQLLKQLQNREGDLMNYAIARLEKLDFYFIDFSGMATRTCTYQKARYDGTLQGTAVGMTLFYTDLLAKMWACNTFNSKPVEFIPDFVDNEQTFVATPKVFNLESNALAAVRLWFGPNKNGFQVSDNRSAINFARNATQIFALGNDPRAAPDSTGKHEVQEKQASSQFEVTLSWWNNRYEEVARYEKEYERLNEIMKWSTIISWLNAESHSSDLSFLDSYPVNHDLWFPDWAKNNKELKFAAWDKVGFFDKGYQQSKTEAMPILFSPRKYIIGGVSLAEQTLIKESPGILTAEKQLFRRANLTEDLVEPNAYKTFRDTRISFVEKLEEKTVNINLKAKDDYKLRNYFGEVENKLFKWTLAEEAPGSYTYRSSMGEIPIGKLSTARTGKNSFAVAFESQAIDKGMSVARQCSDFSGDLAVFFKNHPEVVRFAKTESGEWCVQLRNSEEWMVLKVHPEDYPGSVNLPDGWAARTSGTSTQSRIVEMKWVSENEVMRMVKRSLPGIEKTNELFTGSPAKFYDDLVDRVGEKGVEQEIKRLRQEGIAEVQRLAKEGEYAKSARYTEKLISYLGETQELVVLKIRNDLKAGLYLIENNNYSSGVHFINEGLTSHPSVLKNANIMKEINEMLRVANITDETRLNITSLAECYFTDRQLFVRANWQGFGSSSRKVSMNAISPNGNPKIFFSDNASFSSVDPSLPFETVMSQIRSIPGAEVYEISAVAIGRNTRPYASIDPAITTAGVVNRVRLQVAPGAISPCGDDDDDDKDDDNKRWDCDDRDRYTVKGPVYYITAPPPSNLN